MHLPSPIYSAVAFYLACSVLYSCATEEGPFGAETFCLLVKKVYHVFIAQVIPPLSIAIAMSHYIPCQTMGTVCVKIQENLNASFLQSAK